MGQITEELKLYREVSSMTGEIIYRYSIADDVMEMYKSNNVKSSFGTTINNYVEMLRSQKYTDGQRSKMESYIEAISTGEMGFFQQEICIKIDNIEACWYKVVGKTLYDDNNSPEYVIGKFALLEQNVDNNANEEMDRLTGVLKSYEFKKQFQAKSCECAGMPGGFAVISVTDVHKLVGGDIESFMDNVYVNIAQHLIGLFSYNAIVGRIKTDEFAVVYYGNSVTTEFLPKIEELKEAICELGVSGLNERAVYVCGGVYCGTFQADEVYNPIEKASMAMTFARYRGNNAIQLYSKDLEDAFHTYNSDSRRIRNAEIKLEHKLIQNTLRVLSESGDFRQTILEMFQIVGNEYNLNKISVYEVDSNKDNVLSTYSWEKEISSGYDNSAMNIDGAVIKWVNSAMEMAVVPDSKKIDASDPLYSALNGRTRAFVLAGYEVGSVSGCICFEIYNAKHRWNASELNIFELMKKLMSSCLVNVRLYNEMISDAAVRNKLDALTGLYKYNVFLEEANKYISVHQEEKLAIICIKLDGFIRVNQSYGYDAGDEVLREYAKVFKNHAERFIMGCRLNADNLIILVRLFDQRGSMISEATVDVLYNDFIDWARVKYPAAPLNTKSGMCRIDGNGKGIAEYIESAEKVKLR